MSDLLQPVQAPDQGEADAEKTSGEIARALGTVWQNFSGQRPKSTSVEISKDSVRCVIEEGGPDAEAAEEDAPEGDARLSATGLKQHATAAVARITGRRVVAFIPKRDKRTEISTQVFLLETLPRRF
jgi:hypothetical protein